MSCLLVGTKFFPKPDRGLVDWLSKDRGCSYIAMGTHLSIVRVRLRCDKAANAEQTGSGLVYFNLNNHRKARGRVFH